MPLATVGSPVEKMYPPLLPARIGAGSWVRRLLRRGGAPSGHRTWSRANLPRPPPPLLGSPGNYKHPRRCREMNCRMAATVDFCVSAVYADRNCICMVSSTVRSPTQSLRDDRNDPDPEYRTQTIITIDVASSARRSEYERVGTTSTDANESGSTASPNVVRLRDGGPPPENASLPMRPNAI